MTKAGGYAMEIVGHEDKSANKIDPGRPRTAGPNPKKRVSQACSRCRSRKDKCDGQRPTCSTCAAADEVCTYDPATKKRGLPEGYVRGIEKLWGISLRKSDSLEETVLDILAQETSAANVDALARLWNDKEDGETLLETWRKSNVFQELERLLPLLDLSDDKSGKRKLADIAFSRRAETDRNRTSSASAHIEAERRPSPPTWISDQRGELHNHSAFQSADLGFTADIQIPTISPLPDSTWHLIDIYFSYTHCWLPIIEKPDLMKISYQYPEFGSAFPQQSGNHAVLWAVLAYANHQDRAIGALSQRTVVAGPWTTEKLYREAKASIPAEDGAFDLGHVQALLVLSLLNMGLGHWNRAWLLVGQAARIAINLGLDKTEANKTFGAGRVLLCCFAVDTLIAIHLDRKPQLRISDLKFVGALDEHGSDEWSPWVDSYSIDRRPPEGRRGPAAIVSTFNRLITIIKILNIILHDDSTGTTRVDKCQQLLDELNSYGQLLSIQLTLTPNALDARSISFLPHQYHLRLAYCSALAAVSTHFEESEATPHVLQGVAFEKYAVSAHQTMLLLMRYSENFGLSFVPPTFDCFTTISLCSFNRASRGIWGEQYLSQNEWLENMLRLLSRMSSVWPTFKALELALKEITPPAGFSHESSLLPLTTDYNHYDDSDQALSQSTPQLQVIDNISGYGSGPRSGESGLHLVRNHSDTRLQSRAGQSISSDVRSTAGSSISLQDPAIVWNQFTEQPPADNHNIFNAADSSIGSHMDGDTIFNEIAALDAMEWNNNWDQGLLNLGFTETERMTQDFSTFCQLPEPMPNDLIQQLLADAELAGPFGGGMSGLPDPHMLEASETLHSIFKRP